MPSVQSARALNSSGSVWSDSLQELLDQPTSQLPIWIALGGMTFSGAFGAWAWLGHIQEVSRAQGKLVPKGQVYKVQPTTPGKVDRILVKEGQTVRAGQPIATLDNRLAIAEVERLQQDLFSHQVQLSQTKGLMERMALEMASRQAATVAEQRAQIAAIAETQAEATTQQQLEQHLHSESAAYQARLERLQPLVKEGAISSDRLFEVEQSLRQQQQALTTSQGELRQNLAQIAQLKAGLEQKQAEGSQRFLEAQQRLQQLQTEIAQRRAKIRETETLLQAAKTKAQQMELDAPISGTISMLKVQNVGEVMQPGQTVAEIAPGNAPLIVLALLPSQEAGLVEVGMSVQVKLDAFPYQDYGVVTGRVAAIAPDALTDQQLGSVYPVEIALDQHSFHEGDRRIAFKAGQTASAEIITRQRRIVDVLLEPIRRLQESEMGL